MLTKRVLPTFADRPLESITRADLREWMDGQPKSTPAANAAAYPQGFAECLRRRVLHSRDLLRGAYARAFGLPLLCPLAKLCAKVDRLASIFRRKFFCLTRVQLVPIFALAFFRLAMLG